MPVVIRGRRVLFLPAQPGDGPHPIKKPPCAYCGKTAHSLAARWGSHIGNSSVLRNNILAGREAETHPWYTGQWSISAHHLICSEALADDEDWARYCREFGYDINCPRNGVMLPSRMDVACQLHVPVHRGNHAGGWAHDVHLAYTKAVLAKLRKVRAQIEQGVYCPDPDKLERKLDKISAEILAKIASFTWTISSDGLDYQEGGLGCAGATSITDKACQPCPRKRQHGIQCSTTGQPLTRRALRAGE